MFSPWFSYLVGGNVMHSRYHVYDENCLIHWSLCYDLYFNVSLCISYVAGNFVAQYFSPCGSSFKFINVSHIHMFLVFLFYSKMFILNEK